ncbi:MAG: hypothetical protein Pars2KO_30560 [Parasphingorhabdus sp.]
MFVTLSVAAMLSMAAGSGNAMENARTVYSNCIVENTIPHLGQKTAEKDFSKAVKSWCQDEQKTFFSAVVASEMAEGLTQKEAQEVAKEEIDLTIEDSVVNYADHLAAGTLPVKEG